MKNLKHYIVILGFAAVLFLPVLFRGINSRFGLTGVSVAAELPALSKRGLLDGTVQENLGTYYAENLPGRGLMIKLRNQMIYSLYHKSPNKNIVIGKNGTLFEKEYVLKYEKVYPPATPEYTKDLCDKLTILRDKLEAHGKELYIFITPTKVRYYEEDIPDIYHVATTFAHKTGNYEIFKQTLEDYDLKVFDSIPFVDEYAKTAKLPLFYKTGTHWSWVTGMEVACGLNQFLDENSRFDFPAATVEYEPIDAPVHPDADIFNTLNIFTKPYDSYYSAELVTKELPLPEPRPNLFCRGGSFMGQTIRYLIDYDRFQSDTYIQNTMVQRNHFTTTDTFSDYSEIDLAKELSLADMVILEVNEAHIPDMSFGLIDYLAEHQDLLDALN